MSQLNSVKAQLLTISADAKNTSAGLTGFKSTFSKSVGEVQGSIGGTASGTDRKMIQTLQAAEKQLDAAIGALQQASTSASKFASSL